MTRMQNNFEYTLAAPSPGRDGKTSEERYLRLKKELHQQLIASMDLAAIGKMGQDELRAEVRRAAEELCHRSSDLLNLSERERLIGEVLWSFAESGLRHARAQARGAGPDAIADVFEHFIRLNAAFDPLRRFIEQDAELALRVLTSKNGPVQERMIAAARELLVEQVDAGELRPALDVDTLAYLIVRVAESFLYSDIITGSEPDVDQAIEVVRVLLHAPPLPPRRR
jgi:hypothetical protein